MSALLSDEETEQLDEEDEDDMVVSSFSQRLTKFKPSAKAKSKRS